MRAVAAVTRERRVELLDHPKPSEPKANEVLLAVLDVGICGTDREIAAFEYGSPPSGEPYLVIGHESLMRVRSVGSEVTRLRTGDLVVPMVRRPCHLPRCAACRMGRQDFCQTGEFTERGIRGVHGFMTDFVLDEERYCHVVPESLRSVGVLVEPLTIAQKALIEAVQVQDRLPWLAAGQAPGSTALVLGAGPVGLLGALALLVRGFQTSVYSREPNDSNKAEWVRAVGGKYISSADVPITELSHYDVIYEATGSAGLAFSAIPALGPNGVFIFTGVPSPHGPIGVGAAELMRNLVLNNQLIYGSVNAGANAYVAAVQDLTTFQQRWPEQLKELITARHAVKDAPALLTQPAEGIKHVVSFENWPT